MRNRRRYDRNSFNVAISLALVPPERSSRQSCTTLPRQFIVYGLGRIDPEKDVQEIKLIEAADRILPALPERLSEAATKLLENLGVRVRTSSASPGPGNRDPTGNRGVHSRRASGVGSQYAGTRHARNSGRSETGSPLDQLRVVLPTLQTTRDENVFAFGDCAAYHRSARKVRMFHRARRPRTNRARTFSSRSSAVWQIRSQYRGALQNRLPRIARRIFHGGTSWAGLLGRGLWIEGLFARLMYRSLYKMHQVHYIVRDKVTLDTLARLITRRNEPHVKLH